MLPIEFINLNKAIKSAGLAILNYYGKQLQLDHKSTTADYRTIADIEAEKIIIKAIETLFPDYNIFAEEHGKIQKNSLYTFVIDPLDGTNNFVLGVPVFTTSVALMKGKETIYGVINNPITGDIYYAMKGKGAFLNDKQITVSAENQERNITVSYLCNYITPKERIIEFKTKLANLDVRRDLDLWAAAFCYCSLASGKIEAIINDSMELYDFAAGKLIALEAGAKATCFSGKNLIDDTADTFIISNGDIVHSLLVDRVTNSFHKTSE